MAPEDLLELYDWPQPRWVRACMVMSLDGAVAGPDGTSGSISSVTDRAVLSAVRALADAYLVGAGTLRAEGYGPVRARPEHLARRRARRQADAATLVAVSASCRFDWATTRFQDSDLSPVILTTGLARDEDVESARAAGCDVVVVGREQVDAAEALEVLAGRGLTRITVEGGPRLLRQVVGAGVLDEMDLTISPVVTGSAPPGGAPAAAADGMHLAQLLEADSFLFTRYVREGGA